jgi:hypothetical protein
MSKNKLDKIYKGIIINWNWTRRYGIIRLEEEKYEVLAHESNVCMKARDQDGNVISYNGKPVIGRDAPRGFLDSEGNELEICKYIVWFDIGETVYFNLNPNYGNIALNISTDKDETKSAYLIITDETRQFYKERIEEIAQKAAERRKNMGK